MVSAEAVKCSPTRLKWTLSEVGTFYKYAYYIDIKVLKMLLSVNFYRCIADYFDNND